MPTRILTETMRDIPLFVTVMMVYFVAPAFGVALDPFGATVVGLGAWGGANGSTIIKQVFWPSRTVRVKQALRWDCTGSKFFAS